VSQVLDNLVYALEQALNDPTVLFLTGNVNRARHEQLRTVRVVRARGTLKPSTGPARTRVLPNGSVLSIVFTRDEVFTVRVFAEDEDKLDVLFDALTNGIFRKFGPNAMTGNVEYRWLNDDSQGGTHTSRQPGIEFDLRVNLRSLPRPEPATTVDEAEATVTALGHSVTVATPAS
jgi:hypothetical protein